MSRLWPAMRVSLGFALVVITIMITSDLLGIIPDPAKAELEGRKKLAETLAVQYSLAASKNDYDVITSSMKMLVERNDDVVSAGLRNTRGDLLATAGDHQALWEPTEDENSTLQQMQVPIFKDRRLRSKWATVELRFNSSEGLSIFGVNIRPFVLMTAFVAVSAFVAFLFLVKRIFTSIDPGAVVPTRVRRALDTLTEGVLLIDMSGKIMFANQVFCAFVSKTNNELIGKRVASLGWASKDEDLPWNKTLADGKSGIREPLNLQDKHGYTLKFMVNSSLVSDDKGIGQGAMITFDDVTELDAKNIELSGMVNKLKESAEQISRHNDELRVLATRDPLTGCLNRRSLFDKYESIFFEARTSGKSFACLMMDIDHFKAINDTYGHMLGDEVLVSVARGIQKLIPDDAVMFRYGGEEFCILLTASSGNRADKIAEEIRVAVEQMVVSELEDGDTVRITTSLGVSRLNDDALNLSSLIDQADKALYVSKHNGRNRVTTWSHELEKSALVNLSASNRSVDGHVHRSGHDTVTGLPDSGSFRHILQNLIERDVENEGMMAVVMLDVDMFQRLNFALGHEAGDHVLVMIAERISSSMRSTDVMNQLSSDDVERGIFRLGGDEFGILLTDIDSAVQVETIVGRIMASISSPLTVEGQEVFLTCCAGISLYPDDGNSALDLIADAGVALKQAKRAGLGKISFYDHDFVSTVKRDYQIENDLRYAIENDELELYFQPKLDINTMKIESMEALVRWNHPDTGLRMPGEFISAAEASGLINPMGKWVMDAACRQVRAWQDDGFEMPVSINVSPIQFRQDDLIAQINSAVSAAHIEPRMIDLEITESAIMENVETSLETMSTLSRHGYQLSIDDFGIGYSSLEHLRSFPLDVLKIDRCFVREIDQGESELAIARAIVEMSHSMGLRVVAEGVETESQLEVLREIGCDEIQGYLMGPPLPARDAIRLVEENLQKVNNAL